MWSEHSLSIGAVIDQLVLRDLKNTQSAVVSLEPGVKPTILHNNLASLADERSLKRFVEALYVLSPYYQAHEDGTLPTAGRLHDLAQRYSDAASEYPTPTPCLFSPDDEIFYSVKSDRLAILYVIVAGKGRGLFTPAEREDIAQKQPAILTLLTALLNEMRSVKQESEETLHEQEPLEQQRVEDPRAVIEDQFATLLSPRERSVVAMTLEGRASHIIADRLGISPHTVRVHLRNSYGKLRVRNKLELVGMFMRKAGFRSAMTRA